MRSVVFRTCSRFCSLLLRLCEPLYPLWLKILAAGDCPDLPHRIQSNLLKSKPAAAAEAGSKLSLASIRTQVSPRRVAAAIVARSRLVFPEDAGPQISLRQPRGRPPVMASTSGTPVESISGWGRTSSRDAVRTAARRSEAA